MGGQLFYRVGIKKAYIISFTSGLIGGAGVLYLEYYNTMMKEKELTPQQLNEINEMFQNRMPWAIFVAKFGTASGFLISYMASFADNRIFPIEKRATAIGICNFIGRSVTSSAPMINEFTEPWPMCFFLIVMGFAWVFNFTL